MVLTRGWILPSKFLLLLATAATARSPSVICFETSSERGPEFPMQVMHPYPQFWNPSASRYCCRPDFTR